MRCAVDELREADPKALKIVFGVLDLYGLPRIYREARIEIPELLDWAHNPVDALYLHGTVGAGKTWAAWGVMIEYVAHRTLTGSTMTNEFGVPLYPGLAWHHIKHRHQGFVAFGITAQAFYDAAKPNGIPEDDRGTLDADPTRIAAMTDLLLLDDLGRGKSSDWDTRRLHQLVEGRRNNGLPLVVTSNFTPARLREEFDPATVDRILQDAVEVEMTGNHRRWLPGDEPGDEPGASLFRAPK